MPPRNNSNSVAHSLVFHKNSIERKVKLFCSNTHEHENDDDDNDDDGGESENVGSTRSIHLSMKAIYANL